MLNFLYNLDNLYNVLYLVSFSLIVSNLIIGSIIKLAGRAGKEALDIVAKIVGTTAAGIVIHDRISGSGSGSNNNKDGKKKDDNKKASSNKQSSSSNSGSSSQSNTNTNPNTNK